jgi:hypothetical protein
LAVVKNRDWKVFCNLIHAADEVTVGKPRSEAALALMFEALKGHTLDEIKDAVSKHISVTKFAITPADITRLISGSPEEKSAVAWQTFLRAFDRYSFYDSVRFPDPAYHYAIQQLGGWERLCEDLQGLSDRELQFRAKDWRQLYEIGLRRASWGGEPGKIAVPQYLWGFFERDNREKHLEKFIPEVIDIETGEKVNRFALTAEPEIIHVLADIIGTEPNQ